MNVTRHGGVFYRKGFQASNQICENLEAHLSCLDPGDFVRSARLTDVVMSVTASSGLASLTQPVAAENKVLLAWDGRLDNRSTIASDCKLGPDKVPEDAAVVAIAYSARGPTLWPDVIGDYAVACWDSVTKQLYLARDPFGTRPLYYYIDDSIAIWCSELTYFIDLLGDALVLDDEYIVSYLTATEEQGKTPYRNISSVRPGYVIAIGGDDVSHRQLWDVASCANVKLESDADYEARFRELFAQSLKRRLRPPGKVIAELSGGLDSSSIVCMADQMLDLAKESRERLSTVSYLYDGSRTSDERRFITEIEHLRGISTQLIYDRDIIPLTNILAGARPNCLHLFRETFETLQALIASLGATTLLSGCGGDQVTLNEEIICPDLMPFFKRGEFGTAFRAASSWAHSYKTTTIACLWKSSLLPRLPSRLRRAVTPKQAFPKHWTGNNFSAGTTSPERLRNQRRGSRALDPVRERQCDLLDQSASFTSQCYYRERNCGDVTYPFLDRCLVEFLVGIPADQKIRPNETRSIHRRAMKRVLPEKIRSRRSKEGPDEPMMRALTRCWPELAELFRDSEVSRRGYINGESFLSDLIRAKHGLSLSIPFLARVLSLELWLRGRRSTNVAFTTLPRDTERRESQDHLKHRPFARNLCGQTHPFVETSIGRR
jgi:asparagine synthase (glutamine-hydrolysing)